LIITRGTRGLTHPHMNIHKNTAKSAVPWAWKYPETYTKMAMAMCWKNLKHVTNSDCFCCLVPDIVMFVDCWDSNNIYYIYVYILWYMFGNYCGQKCKDRP
jgi:hypothetical protein